MQIPIATTATGMLIGQHLTGESDLIWRGDRSDHFNVSKFLYSAKDPEVTLPIIPIVALSHAWEGKVPDDGLQDQGINSELARTYRAITRHTDGRIIHVEDFQAASDAEAVLIVTARGSNIRTDLWSDQGLVQRFGAGSG